tara:strand:- start:92 stop:910 length:819 start_codon:yes stop_codon:yes gene_type:complete
MTKNLDSEGLRAIIENYDLFFIDLWGVVHNGIKLHEEAIDVLDKISKGNKNYILLTNAPRPNNNVKLFLEKMGMKKNMREKVFTSGEAALVYLRKNHLNQSFYHVGPPRDFDLFNDFKNNQTENINNCNYLLCTGLFDYADQDLNFYIKLFKNSVSKKMICTNPDLIVDRGENREYCAGSVAKVFEKLGGEVVYFGKPYPEIYNQSVENNNKKIIAIGDNLNTDIKGASNMNYDSLIITEGVHKEEIRKQGIEQVLKKYSARVNFSQSVLKW